MRGVCEFPPDHDMQRTVLRAAADAERQEATPMARSSRIPLAFGWSVGVVLLVVFYVVRWTILPYYGTRVWGPFALDLGSLLTAIVPGLAAGLIAGRSGALVGATSGLVGALAGWPVAYGEPHSIMTTELLVIEMARAVALGLSNGVSGMAGACLRRLPSSTTPHTGARAGGRGHQATQ
jgi:hypothetical protein